MADNVKIIWDFLKKQGYTDAGASGIMGNLYAESAFNPTNLQNTFEKKLGLNDIEYTTKVDNGIYTNFIHDGAGYGLAQWTYWSRKQGLLNYAKSKKVSIGNLTMQLEYLIKEFSGYKGLVDLMKTTSSVKEASDFILLNFERPKDQSEAVKNKRFEYSQNIYNTYAGKATATTTVSPSGYSNSKLISVKKLSPNNSGKRNHKIDRISPHCVVGQMTAEALGNWFAQTSAKASSNYGIGKDGKIGLYVEESNRSWCTSSSANDNRAVTIECASDTTDPYRMNDEVYQSLIKLCADICQRNGKNKLIWIPDKTKALAYEPKDNEMLITVHRWFANKSCPGEWLYSRLGDLANKVNTILQSPTTDKKEEEDETMTQEKFNEMMNVWLNQQAEKQPSTWSANARSWAENKKIISGDTQGNMMYKKPLTREELIQVLYRFFVG